MCTELCVICTCYKNGYGDGFDRAAKIPCGICEGDIPTPCGICDAEGGLDVDDLRSLIRHIDPRGFRCPLCSHPLGYNRNNCDFCLAVPVVMSS